MKNREGETREMRRNTRNSTRIFACFASFRVFRLLFLLLLLSIGFIALFWWWTRPPKPFIEVVTLAVAGRREKPVKIHHQPFGIVSDQVGNIFVSETVTGSIYRIPADGYLSTAQSQNETIVADHLETPSALALDNDGNLIVANTGAHTILRIDFKNKRTSIIAGADGRSGFVDGPGSESRFNGPVGIAAADDGTIYVADTYNDRIRMVTPDNRVITLAGNSKTGFADGIGAEARFDTPCGIAIAKDGSLLVVDTGNHRIRRVELNGRVTTVAGTGEGDEHDGPPPEAAFNEPTGITIRDSESFFVADAAGSTVRLVTLGKKASVVTLAGGYPYGLYDGALSETRLNRPTGVALLPGGELIFADSDNGLVRALVTSKSKIGHRVEPQSVIIQMPEMRALVEPRWPFDPPEAPRDVSGTFGEIRGERQPESDAWFHNGLDVAGAYGETVRAVLDEHVARPLAVESAGGLRERFCLSLFTYAHLRVGRDQNDQLIGNFTDGAISFHRNEQGQVTGVRLRRGTRIKVGDAIGTLNRLNHVHLIAGPPTFEFNPLAVLKLPWMIDTVKPVIEAVTIVDEQGLPLAAKDSKRIQVKGKLRISVRAYDQVDGNPRYRRLGLYRLGYQILDAADFREPRYNLIFDRLPADPDAASLAYSEGSGSGYQGVTVFDYIVTNVVRGGEAREEFCDTTKFTPGDYTLRVLAEDYFGNQTCRDVSIKVKK